MSDTQSDKPAQRGNDDGELTEAEIAARFESTVRRMANTKSEPKQAKKMDRKTEPKQTRPAIER